MLFNSPVYFLIFLPITCLIYFFLNKNRLLLAGKIWLVLASLFFYGYWHASYLTLLLISIIFNYTLGIAIRQCQQWKRGKFTKKGVLVFGLLCNIGALAYFKYSDFFLRSVNQLLGSSFSLLQILLPLGISFFTFQQIAYLVDCYHDGKDESSFLDYCLFVVFFPKLITGPIVNHKEMMLQFAHLLSASIQWNNIATGILFFCIGLFKKVFIADTLSVWANKGFDQAIALNFFEAWGTSLCYTFQLYFDFSGYADMAIGSALLFNIRLPFNFNSPYKAVSIQDFWRRWHITLSSWLRDYIYIPLGGNRLGMWLTHYNVIVTFLIGGLWHGANWTFVAWGGLHGLALVGQRIWSQTGLRLPIWFAWPLTFLFINATWVLFRAKDFESAEKVFSGMIGMNKVYFSKTFADVFNYFFPFSFIKLIGTPSWNSFINIGTAECLLVASFLSFIPYNSQELILNRMQKFTILKMCLCVIVVFAVYMLSINRASSEFLYFNF